MCERVGQRQLDMNAPRVAIGKPEACFAFARSLAVQYATDAYNSLEICRKST